MGARNCHPGIRWTARSLVGLVVLTQVIGVAAPSWRIAVTGFGLLALDLCGAAFGVVAARRGAYRAGWVLVSAGRLLGLVANTSLGFGYFWPGAISGLLMYVAYAIGLLTLPAQRMLRRQRAALAGEAVTILGCGFMYVWYFVLRPHLERTGGERWPVSLGFPLGDLLLLIAVAVVVLRGGLRTVGRPTGLLVAGTVMFVLADVFFNAGGYDGGQVTGSVAASLSVIVASLFMTLAAVWASAFPARDSGERLRPLAAAWFSYLPYAAVGAGLVLMIGITLHTGQILTWGGLILGLVLMTAGVAGRQIVSLRDSQDQRAVDQLTGLANLDGLVRYAMRASADQRALAVLYVNLDGFKSVNDKYGMAAGDQVLLEFAQLLRSSIRARDIAARIGRDEYVVMQYGVTEPADAVALGRRILAAAANRPVHIGDHTVVTRASIGIAFAEPGSDPDDLRRRCGVALYHAKRTGQHGIVVYEPGMLDRQADDEALGRDLDHAAAGGQLRVLYQPMIDLAGGRPIGFEALVRWQHPTRGLVSPLDFIPIAERTGAIVGIGLHVLEEACRQAAAWPDHRYVSVNLSPRQLPDPALVGDVLAVLERTGLPPDRLVLEVTESAIVEDRTAIPTLTALRTHGIRIAIDDFGTGYSSLQYLTRLPVDILKIDRAFVAELDGTSPGAAIAEAVIRLAQILHLTTVAEGIETGDQAAELRRLGCDTGQGFLYARPLAADEAARFVETARAL